MTSSSFESTEGSTYYQIGENVLWYNNSDPDGDNTGSVVYALGLLNSTYEDTGETYSGNYEFYVNEDSETKEKCPLKLRKITEN